jgi:hypothetical protein
MSKLIALGCSYTRFGIYPTWADLLSNYPKFDKYQNWGMVGLGNRGIFNRLNEVILKENITKDDTIVIMWSTPVREDRLFYKKGWVPCGNIYNQSIYSKEWIEKHFDPFMAMMETVNYVHAAQHVLDNIGCNWSMAWMSNPSSSNKNKNWGESPPDRDYSKSIAELCDPDKKLAGFINKINSHPRMVSEDMDEFKYRSMTQYNIPPLLLHRDSKDKEASPDGHPSSLVGYYYLKEKMLPVLGISDFDLDRRVFQLATEWTEFTSQSYQDHANRPKFSLIRTGNDYGSPNKTF